MTTPDDERAPELEPRPEAEPERAAEPGPPMEPAESRGEKLRRHGRRIWLYTWTTVLVVALGFLVALIASNARTVHYSWIFGQTDASLIWVILVCGFAGWLSGIATSLLLQWRTRRRRRRP